MLTYTVEDAARYLAVDFWAAQGTENPAKHLTHSSRVTYYLDGLEGYEIALVEAALDAWSHVTDIDFIQVQYERLADIVLESSDPNGFTYWEGYQAIVNVGSYFTEAGVSTVDNYGFQTWLHEIGHALGLGHPGLYDGWAEYGVDNHFANDSWQMTIMSYFSQTDNWTIDADYAYTVTPMPADIEAMRLIYGYTGAPNSGGTIYGWNTNTQGHERNIWTNLTSGGFENNVTFTIVDWGGVDLINLGLDQADQMIDLRPGAASTIFGVKGSMLIDIRTEIENVNAGQGNDVVIGNDADNRLKGARGNDRLEGLAGNDRLFGQDGHDTLLGGAGNDLLFGLAGNDELIGGAGDDLLIGHAGADRIFGGPGTADMTRYTDSKTGVNVALDGSRGQGGSAEGDVLIGVEHLHGSHYDDEIWGSGADNRIWGRRGDDQISGMGGADTLVGGPGNDELSGGAGDDRLIGSAGADWFDGGAGNDLLIGGAGADCFVFNAGNDRIADFALNDSIELDASRLGIADADALAAIIDDATIYADAIMLDFGAGNSLIVAGITDLDLLEARIDLI